MDEGGSESVREAEGCRVSQGAGGGGGGGGGIPYRFIAESESDGYLSDRIGAQTAQLKGKREDYLLP